jgi:hypothetical protein
MNPASSNSTYLSLNGRDYRTGIGVDSSGHAYLTGFTRFTSSDLFSISGTVQTSNGTGVAYAQMNLYTSTGSYSSALTDYLGNYSIDNIEKGGDYTLIPFLEDYVFEPDSQSFPNLQANATANFIARSTITYSLSGYVLTADGDRVAGVLMELFGPTTEYFHTLTDSDGHYSFDAVPESVEFLLLPSLSGYIFDPEAVGIYLQYHQTVDFEATSTATYNISGYVETNIGDGVEGVSMELHGPTETLVTFTDSYGYYSFDDLAQGDYTLTPTLDSYVFDPEEQTFTDLQADETADFTATSTATYSISGYVTRSDGVGLEFVLISLYGGGQSTSTFTHGDGSYSFDDLPAGGNYVVSAPGCCLYIFDPLDQYFDNLQSNERADFETISIYVNGYVYDLDTGEGLNGVTITMSGGPEFETRTTTTQDGSYYFTDVPSGANSFFLKIEPTRNGYKFEPTEHFIFPVASEDQPGLDFTAKLKTYAIIGTVKLGPARLPGVTVKLTSPNPAGFTPLVTTTNSGGAYSFNRLLPGRNYTVTAMKTGYQLMPGSRLIPHLGSNKPYEDFTVKAHSITGRITRTNTNTGIGAVTVTLTSPSPANFPARTLRTSNNGTYTFINLPAGRAYRIKAVKGGFTFSPPMRSITNLNSNIPAGASTNFTGKGP